MELKQCAIHRKYRKGTAKNQMTIGDDYSLPEGKPDIARILQRKAEVQVEEVHAEKGKIRVRGKLHLAILYLAEHGEAELADLHVESPFDEILYMEDASNGDHLEIGWNVDELKVVIVHPGKISVRAVVTLYGSLLTEEEQMISEDVEGEKDIFTKTENFMAAETVVDQKESYRVREDISLPANKPNVEKILWKELQLRKTDFHIQEGRVAIRGELLFWVIYESEGSGKSVQWIEQMIPFQGTLEMAGVTQEMCGMTEAEISMQSVEVRPDYDGELRVLHLETVIDLHLHIYDERNYQRLVDAYGTKEQFLLKSQELSYEKMRLCQNFKCRVSSQENTGEEDEIGYILGHQAILQKGNTKRVEEGIFWESGLEVQVLYLTAGIEPKLGSVTLKIPCSQVLEIPRMEKEDLWKISEQIEQILIAHKENVLEVRGVIGLNLCVMEQCCSQNVTEIAKECYDMDTYKNSPGMLLHFVQPKETLWDIAKKNRIAPSEILRQNELATDEITVGQKLLLFKKYEEELLL